MNLQESLRGSGALLGHGLNQLARSSEPHLIALFFAIPAMLGIFQCFAVQNMTAAPGLMAFKVLVYGDAICLVLLGTPYFAAAIAEEQELGMLGLLKLSGISPVGLLLGKSTVRLFPTCMGLLLQVPLVMLAVTLGGVTYWQIGAAFFALLAFLILLVNISLRMSLSSPTTAEATAKTWGILLLIALVPQIFYLPTAMWGPGQEWTQKSGWLATSTLAIHQWIVDKQIHTRLAAITTSTFWESWLSSQVVLDLFVSAILFSICWRSFEKLTQERVPVIGSSPGATKTTKSIGRRSVPSWDDALAWKEFHYGSGGWSRIRISIVTMVILFVIVFGVFWYLFNQHANFGRNTSFQNFWMLFQEFGPALLLIGLAICIATFLGGCAKSFHIEIFEKTYGTLMLIPLSADRIILSTLKGRLMEALPFLGLFLLGCLWTLVTNNWMTRISIEGFHAWLALFLLPCCALVTLGDIGLAGFYLGLWRSSLLWTFFCGVGGMAMLYLEIATFIALAGLLSQQNVVLACALVLARMTGSLLLWKYWWRRLPILMHDRMRD